MAIAILLTSAPATIPRHKEVSLLSTRTPSVITFNYERKKSRASGVIRSERSPAGLRERAQSLLNYISAISESGSSFFTLMRASRTLPARAVIESRPQAALFVLSYDPRLAAATAEPVYRRFRTWTGERMRSVGLIERKQFRLTCAVVTSPPDRIDDDAKEIRSGRGSRDRETIERRR